MDVNTARQICGPELVARIEECVAAAPPPSPEELDLVRRLFGAEAHASRQASHEAA